VVFAAATAAAAPDLASGLTPGDVQDFLGGLTGRLGFVHAEDTYAYCLDLASLSTPIPKIADTAGARSPLISSDGTRIVYWTGGQGASYVKDISTTGTATSVKSSGAFDPHWDPTDNGYVIYVTSMSKDSGLGKTVRRRLSDGSETDLWPTRAMDSGLSPDGRWLGEAYGNSFAVDLDASPPKEYDWSWYVDSEGNELQTCNGSMSADAGSDWRMMTLMIPHEYIRIWKWDDVKKRWPIVKTFYRPEGAQEWQHPEWSNHPDFAVATAGRYVTGPYKVYLMNTTIGTGTAEAPRTDGILEVVSSDSDFPCLWLERSGACYLLCQPAELTFTALEGEASPVQKTVELSNWGTGTSLGTVAVANGGSLPGWLGAGIAGSTLTVTADPSGLAAKPQDAPYAATIELTAANSTNATVSTPRELAVSFYVLSAAGDRDGDGASNEAELAAVPPTDPLDIYHPAYPTAQPPPPPDGGGCSPGPGCAPAAAWLALALLGARRPSGHRHYLGACSAGGGNRQCN
jgi:hypothetical protein